MWLRSCCWAPAGGSTPPARSSTLASARLRGRARSDSTRSSTRSSSSRRPSSTSRWSAGPSERLVECGGVQPGAGALTLIPPPLEHRQASTGDALLEGGGVVGVGHGLLGNRDLEELAQRLPPV